MKTTEIYIYDGENGVIQTPIKLGIEANKTMQRLSSDIGNVLTDGIVKTNCIDIEVADVNKWQELSEYDADVLIATNKAAVAAAEKAATDAKEAADKEAAETTTEIKS